MGRSKLLGKTVIGIDESNNGFQKKGLPLIIAAHVTPEYTRSVPHNQAFERKLFAYNSKKRKNFVERARNFIEKNNLFCYSTISEDQLKRFGLVGRAKTMASLVAKCIDLYDLSNDLVVISHRIDGRSATKFISETLEYFLEEAGIESRVEFKGDDQKNLALRKADRVAYYLAGLKYANSTKHWPFRQKKTNMDYIDNYTLKSLLEEDSFEHLEEKNKKY